MNRSWCRQALSFMANPAVTSVVAYLLAAGNLHVVGLVVSLAPVVVLTPYYWWRSGRPEEAASVKSRLLITGFATMVLLVLSSFQAIVVVILCYWLGVAGPLVLAGIHILLVVVDRWLAETPRLTLP